MIRKSMPFGGSLDLGDELLPCSDCIAFQGQTSSFMLILIECGLVQDFIAL